jgi:hypothetical protein
MISPSKIESLSLVYFPFTLIAPSLVETLSAYFGRLILYRPVGSPPMEDLQQWMTQGFLEIRVPFEDVIDKNALMAELKQWRTWGLLNQDADTAYLKVAGRQMAPVHPLVPKIACEIKGAAGKTRENAKNRDLTLQLFLHLAQDFDRQSRELGEKLKGFKVQQQALQAFLRVDEPEEGKDPIPPEPFLESNEDLGGLMIEHRMLAWKRLFEADPHESSLLFTDSPTAHAWFLDLAKEKIPLLTFNLPCSPPLLSHPFPWKDPLAKLFHTVLTTPWNEQLQQRVDGTAREIEAMMVSWRESVTKPGEKTASFHWHVVPNQPASNVFNEQRGPSHGEEVRQAENTLVGLVAHGVP